MAIGFYLFKKSLSGGTPEFLSVSRANLSRTSRVSELGPFVKAAVRFASPTGPLDLAYEAYVLDECLGDMTARGIRQKFTNNFFKEHVTPLDYTATLEKAVDLSTSTRNLVIVFWENQLPQTPERHIYPASNARQDNGHTFDRTQVINAIQKLPSPSTGAADIALMDTQRASEPGAAAAAIFNGRPRSLQAAPIQIFSHFLTIIATPIHDLSFSPQELRATREIITASANFYEYKEDRIEAFRRPLYRLIQCDMCARRHVHRGARRYIIPDGGVYLPGEQGVVALLEVENDIDTATCDPTRKVELDYACFIGLETVEEARTKSACPALLITICGDSISQRLAAEIDFASASDSHTQLLQLARLFRAIKVSVQELEFFYSEILSPDILLPSLLLFHLLYIHFDPPALHPHFRKFTNEDGHEVTLTYTDRFEPDRATSATYRALARTRTQGEGDSEENSTDVDVVVKFTRAGQYGAEAHAHLAKYGFAPRIWYCGVPPDVGLTVVVMDLVPGQTAYDFMQPESASESESAGRFPADVAPSLRSAVECMHAGGYVFGDLRPPNIMVNTGNGSVMIVDFDWCGLEYTVRYPVDISTTIKWHRGVEPGGLIRREHDVYMMKKMTG